MRSEVGVGVALFVEECLPLTHHAEVAVVDEGNLDRDTFEGTGCEFLIGHLEAAVAVDRPHLGVGHTHLGAHGCGNRVPPHGAEPARVEHVRGFS